MPPTNWPLEERTIDIAKLSGNDLCMVNLRGDFLVSGAYHALSTSGGELLFT